MKGVFRALVLLLAMPVVAQQVPPGPPPHQTPSTFPESRQQARRQQMWDGQEAPQVLSSTDVLQNIQNAFDSEPALRGTDIGVNVNGNSVLLSGTLASERQHQRALQIAQSYSGNRKIIDHINIRQQS